MQTEPEQDGRATRRLGPKFWAAGVKHRQQTESRFYADGTFRRGALICSKRERENGQNAQEGNLRCVKLTNNNGKKRQRKQL